MSVKGVGDDICVESPYVHRTFGTKSDLDVTSIWAFSTSKADSPEAVDQWGLKYCSLVASWTFEVAALWLRLMWICGWAMDVPSRTCCSPKFSCSGET
jgi:hypothetical protein